MQNDHRQVFFRPGFSNAVHQAIIVICAAGGTNVANLRTKYAQVYVNIIIKNGCGGGENRTPVRKAKPINVYMCSPNFKFTVTAPPDKII